LVLIFLGCSVRNHGTVLYLEDQRRNEFLPVLVHPLPGSKNFEDEDEDEDESKKAFISGKTGNEGIQRVPPKTDRRAGSILLFAEKLRGC
jgi:hypothetical protein